MEINASLWALRLGKEFRLRWLCIFVHESDCSEVQSVPPCIAVLASDYASCLHMLMKYPPIADMQYFIDMARYLREPNVCCHFASLILSFIKLNILLTASGTISICVTSNKALMFRGFGRFYTNLADKSEFMCRF